MSTPSATAEASARPQPLNLRAVTVRVPGPRALVTDLDLRTQPGQVLALIGPNGAGKSTLLRCLTGLAKPASGQIELGGGPLDQLAPRERARMLAYLPQRIQAPAELSVRDVVMLGRAPHQSWLSAHNRHDREAVRDALQRCDALELRYRRLGTLSGGERQRVMLARMLATGCALLILDEPTTALDIGHALRLFTMLKELALSGASVIVAVHELELARRFADRVLCLHGDPQGSWTLGAPSEVLVPEVLDPSFGVRTQVQSAGGALRFELGGDEADLA